MIFFTILIFIAYNCAVFTYAETLFIHKRSAFLTYGLTSIINTSILLTCYLFNLHQAIIMAGLFFIFYIEFQFLYGEKKLKSIFGSLSFCVNLFCVCLIYKGIYTLVTGIHFSQTTLNMEINLFCISVAMMTAVCYLLLFKKYVSYNFMNFINTNIQNVQFSMLLLLFIYIYLIVNTTNYYTLDYYPTLPWLQIKIGICGIIGFVIAIVYAFMLGKLLLFENRSVEIEQIIQVQEGEQEKLENIAYFDVSTNSYKRAYGMEYLEESIKRNKNVFSVVFFDLDGLKMVNDKFGHNEGDIYIESVVNVLRNVFGKYMICRMGGDEFMVVLRDTNQFNAIRYAVQAFESIEMMSKISGKPYPMSMSYGVLDVNIKNKLTSEQILEIVDRRMYEFKNNRKKARIGSSYKI